MYNVRWRLSFTDELGRQKRADVLEKDYSGSIIEVAGAGFSPLSISLQNSGDEKYDTVKSTQISLSIFAETNFEFEEISTATDKQFKIEVYEDSALKHVGYVIPEIYTEPYTDTPYPVTLRATSLGILNNIRYLDDGEFYTGKATLMQVLTRCLDFLDFDLDIWDSVNTWEDRMDTGISPLLQTEVDQQAYIIDDRGAERAMKCIDVIEAILKPFAVNFFQDYGRWVIIPIEQRASSRSVRIFNSSGTLQNTTTHNPTDTITWIEQDQQLQPRPIVREVESEYQHQEIGNLARNGNFDSFYNPDPNQLFFAVPDHWETFGTFDPTFPFPGSGSVAVPLGKGGPLGLVLRSQSISEGGYVFYKTPADVEFADNTKIGLTLRYSPTANGRPEQIVDLPIQLRIGNRYLDATGEWVATPTNIVISDLGDSQFSIFGGGDYRDFEIISEELPINGDLEIRIFRPENDVTDVVCVYAFVQIDYLPEGEPEGSETVFLGERDVESFANGVQYPVIHGDGPTNLHSRSFYIGDSRTENWQRGNLTGSITEIAINEIFREYESRSNVIRGTQRCSLLFDRYFAEFGEAYTPISGSYDERLCYFNGENIQIQAGDVQGTIREVTDRPRGSTSGGSGGRNVRPDVDRLQAIGEITKDYDEESSDTLDCLLDLPVRKGIEYWVVNESQLSRVNRFAGIYPIIPITTKPDGTRLVPSDPDYDDPDNIREYGPGLLEDSDAVPIQSQIINAPAGSLIFKAPGQDEFEQFVTENFQITTNVELTSIDETLTAQASSIFQLETTVTEQDGEIQANASAILGIESEIVDLENDVSANASAVLSLDTRVTSNEGEISANASAILSAESRITDAENDIDVNASSILTLDSEITVIDGEVTNIKAKAALVVDANGVVGSINLTANGLTGFSEIDIIADQVSINNWQFIKSDGSGHGILRSTTQIGGRDAIRMNGTTGVAEFENVIIRSNNSVIGTQDDPVDRLFIGAPAPSGMRAQMLTVTHSETTNPYSVIFNRTATEGGRNTLLVHHPSTSVNNRIAQFTNSSGQVFQIYANGQIQLTGYFDFDSISQPPSPSAGCRLFVQTVTGAGRVLRAKFPNGNVVDIATE